MCFKYRFVKYLIYSGIKSGYHSILDMIPLKKKKAAIKHPELPHIEIHMSSLVKQTKPIWD